MSMSLTSTAFDQGGSIPTRFTCQGDDSSVPLVWSDPPSRTMSFALVVDDRDAPHPRAPERTWVHWVVYDIPAEARALGEGASSGGLPSGAREGLNDWRQTGWGGPCPPIGRHRYRHTLYALDVVLPDLDLPTRGDLERAIRGHVLATAQLVGTYEKWRRRDSPGPAAQPIEQPSE